MPTGGIRVKICGIRVPRYAAWVRKAGADFVGVIHFAGSPRHVELSEMKPVVREIETGRRVAVTVNPDKTLLSRLMDLDFDFFQIHTKSFESEKLRQWSETCGPDRLWLAPKLPPGTPFPEHVFEYAKTLLIDTYVPDLEGGSGKTGDWESFRKLKAKHPGVNWILSGGLNAGNVREAVDRTGTERIDLSSGVESSPGVKDQEKIRAVFDHLKQS